jgi:catechol 2,3-dioxygenase-like lactoylglutathione lyase family enzyme
VNHGNQPTAHDDDLKKSAATIMKRDHHSILIKRLSHMALGVRDLDRQSDFYAHGCGLQIVDRTTRHLFLRAASNHHHVLELMGDQRGLHHIAFEVASDEELDRSTKVLREHGVRIDLGPDRDVEPGIGRLFRFRDPEGNTIELVSDVKGVDSPYGSGPGQPLSLNHVIVYAGNLAKQQDFFVQVLGMRVTDTVPRIDDISPL